ncbi:MAG: hypothetical protein AB9833_10785 [Bacteroidales bacterium]
MKIAEYKLVISFFISFLILTGCSQKQSLEWIPFNWEGDTISGKYIDKAFIYIPVKIDDLPYDFTMQLDLGTIETQFYENSIKPYLNEFTSLANKLDSIESDKNIIFRDVNLQMGTFGLKLDVWHHRNFGEEIPKDSLHSKTPKHIGTIALDMFLNKILVIDYKSCRLAITESMPAEYKDIPAEEFELNNGIIKLPFLINGKECKLMFDTGSSPFALVTSKERALGISDSVITDSLSGPLWWGREITFYGLEINKPIKLGGKVLKNERVYYDKDRLWDEIYKSQNVWGIAGNAYFLDHILILDLKNKLFRVK